MKTQGLSMLKANHSQVYNLLPEIRSAMVKLTIDFEKKALNNINKQLQDCIMNYFFEDFIGDLIKTKFNNQTKTQIKEDFMREIAADIQLKRSTGKSQFEDNINGSAKSVKKYMLLPQKYIKEVIAQKKEQEYIALLNGFALEEIRYTEGELRWRSQIRRKVFSAILLVHFYNGHPVQSVFDMWTCAFPNHSIKKQKKSAKDSDPVLQSNDEVEDLKEGGEDSESSNSNNNSNIFTITPVAQTTAMKRKCSSVDLYEPFISKQYQFDHYHQNFPSETKFRLSEKQQSIIDNSEGVSLPSSELSEEALGISAPSFITQEKLFSSNSSTYPESVCSNECIFTEDQAYAECMFNYSSIPVESSEMDSSQPICLEKDQQSQFSYEFNQEEEWKQCNKRASNFEEAYSMSLYFQQQSNYYADQANFFFMQANQICDY